MSLTYFGKTQDIKAPPKSTKYSRFDKNLKLRQLCKVDINQNRRLLEQIKTKIDQPIRELKRYFKESKQKWIKK